MKFLSWGTGFFLLASTCFAGPINVAFSGNGGVASQSSTAFGGTADRANDGNTDGAFFNGSVTHTDGEFHAWWEVVFNADYSISQIEIFNRTDCCQDRINPFSVFLYDSSSNVVWSSGGNSIILPATTATFAVPDIEGRRVRVQLDGSNYLHMAEVEVMGEIPAPSTVPEPASLVLMGLGCTGLLLRRGVARS